MKKGNGLVACMRDPCFEKITIEQSGKFINIYCELEKGHKGNHQSSLIWKNHAVR